MNHELLNVIKKYTIESHNELICYLLEKSKDNIIAMLIDLLTMYINDKNSSTIREIINVVLAAGYEHNMGKIGYNGFKQNINIDGNYIKCEAKPKNINTEEFEKFKKGQRKTCPSKLNGGGNFTDYTFSRFEKDKKENLNMLISGSIDGRLIYILEFPFNYHKFLSNLEEKLSKWESKLLGSKTVREV
ncbi:MAG: hypothetical protein KatS3mg068_2276 [Candidatus Sericytochromatia bacterium]|nr:MAG: hypothetical protein KatS3mg068_2276 [Candidatus Sericytochromatia bacterium]